MATEPTLPTIWHIPDPLWKKLKPLLGKERQPDTPGRPVVPYRTAFDGILYLLRTGAQWKHAPREFGSGSTPHRSAGTSRGSPRRRRVAQSLRRGKLQHPLSHSAPPRHSLRLRGEFRPGRLSTVV
jgi:transposase